MSNSAHRAAEEARVGASARFADDPVLRVRLMCIRVGLLFRGTWAGWKNSPAGAAGNSMRTNLLPLGRESSLHTRRLETAWRGSSSGARALGGVSRWQAEHEWLEHVSCEGRLKEMALFSLEKGQIWGF